jgi:putative ABC transport system permease protein
MIGIFIGIAAVVSLISLGQGLREGVSGAFASIGTDKILVQPASLGFGPPGTGAASNLTNKDLRTIRDVSNVKLAVGRLVRQVRVEFRDKQVFSFASSIPRDLEQRRLVLEVLNTNIIEGRFIGPGDEGKIVIGNDFSKEDTVFERALVIGDRLTINKKQFEIVGILDKSSNPGGSKVVLFLEQDLRDLLGDQEKYDMIATQVSKGADPELVALDIERSLRKSRDVKEGKEDFSVQTAAAFLDSLDAILGIVQTVLVGIAAISLIVGGIGIMNTMYTAVLERTKEIGVMKAIGARNEDILAIFLVESGLLGALGGFIGALLGMGMAKLVQLGTAIAFGNDIIQASFPWYLLVGAVLFSFIVGSLSGLWPALQAARLKPVDALRYE